ncbi:MULTISPECIES: cell wall elongation regulator TseB-like domain-containing protein [Paenibacillus]|uniref:Cell wall elongation regulator TseB-like domain-containing protein n=1 Tax=Paenibacillus azoreducens TaxID=116718 RepID=A0A919YEY9_9BACL|nr:MULTISPECIES: DUF5590 domain-containing protein [Paenibacillus]MBE9912853.1 DUF5590 domain-containing protein [Paenibacillus donghaensis]GIO49504.1 hypothetical protein J34TS1_42690 [Paenibacillus azoreducens]
MLRIRTRRNVWKNKKKWIFLAIAVFLLILFGLYRYYIYVTQDIRAEETTAILKAKQESGLVKVTESYKSVWDSVCWVIEGLDKENRPVMVWVRMEGGGKVKAGEGAVHQELLADGMSETQIKQKIQQEMPDADKMKLTPGMYNGEYVWQLFYRSKDHYYYQFYRFRDGKSIGGPFTLPNR